MIVSDKYKFIYLATSKTGTTSIYNILGKYNEREYKKHDTLKVLDFDFSDYFIFCFVRNPWDRLLSGYLQSKKPANLSNPYRKYIYDLSNSNSLSSFLLAADQRFWHDYDQSRYYLSKGKKIGFIGRYENLQEDLNTVCDKIGIPQQQLPHKNKSKHKHYAEYYDDETREIVAEKYAKDIEHFGYKYE